MQRIFCIGGPADVGGANTECWHTIKLWRQFGCEVTVVATFGLTLTTAWRIRLKDLGCTVVDPHETQLADVPGLPGAICVGFCNSRFRRITPILKGLGCRLVYVPCMTEPFPDESKFRWPIDHYVFQSDYQRSQWIPTLAVLGVESNRCTQIRGAFDCAEFPFAPLHHAPGTPFIIGRLSRAVDLVDPRRPIFEKFPHDLWEQYAAIPYRPLRARVMGWHPGIESRCGKPPPWAEVFPQGAMSSREFLGSIHALVPGVGCCEENWPRVGLEAMAAGVPVIVEDLGGWREMLGSWRVKDRWDQAYWTARLARNEELRTSVVDDGRVQVALHSRAETLWDGWQEVFRSV